MFISHFHCIFVVKLFKMAQSRARKNTIFYITRILVIVDLKNETLKL